jgi:cytochrome c553
MPERNSAWMRTSVISLVVLTVLMMLIGFVWLPSVHGDFSAQGLWTAFCRAAGVPSAWGERSASVAAPTSTEVVLEREMARAGDPSAIGRGATLALNCTMCHGAQGMSTSRRTESRRPVPEVVIRRCSTTSPASGRTP